MILRQHSLILSCFLLASLVIIAQIQFAFATLPNYRTDRQVHGVLTHGNKATILEVKTTLIDKPNVSWAKSFIGEFVLTWDSYTSHAVGAGWMHMRLNSGIIQSSQTLYYYNANNGLTGFVFQGGDPAGSYVSAKTEKGTYDSVNQCYNWNRIVNAWQELKCLPNFTSGLGEVWSISASQSNTFSSSTEYTGLQYKSTGGTWTNWSLANGSIYCSDASPFRTNQVTNWNSWNVVPPGTATACSGSNFTAPKPIPG